MSSISVIGSGNMAGAIGALALKGGNTVEIIGRDADKAGALARTLGTGATTGTWGATPTGDIVILAVPYPALADVIAVHGESLAGRIVVDITNPLDFQSFDSLTAHPTAPPRRNWQRPCRNRGAQGVQHHPRRRHRRPVADDRADRG